MMITCWRNNLVVSAGNIVSVYRKGGGHIFKVAHSCTRGGLCHYLSTDREDMGSKARDVSHAKRLSSSWEVKMPIKQGKCFHLLILSIVSLHIVVYLFLRYIKNKKLLYHCVLQVVSQWKQTNETKQVRGLFAYVEHVCTRIVERSVTLYQATCTRWYIHKYIFFIPRGNVS